MDTSDEAALLHELEGSSLEADEEFAALSHSDKICYLHSLQRKLRSNKSSYLQRMHRNRRTHPHHRQAIEGGRGNIYNMVVI